MNASDNNLENSKERDDKFVKWGGFAVILGIAIEFFLALIFREHKSLLENWGPVAADALVGLGIIAEVHFAARSGAKSEELRRRAIDRLADAETSLKAAKFRLLFAEAKLEPRRLSNKDREIIIDKIRTSIRRNINFVIEQNDKASAFAWSIIGALKEGGAPVVEIPHKMPPGEKLICPVMLHCPDGNMSTDDPLCQALNAAGIQVGMTSLTTLSLAMKMPTPLDIGKVFSPFPTGSSLPNDEYIVWVGEQSVFDDQREISRRFEDIFGGATQK